MGNDSGKNRNSAGGDRNDAHNSTSGYTRRAYHAGSWYARDGAELDRQLQHFLDRSEEKTATIRMRNDDNKGKSGTQAEAEAGGRLRGLICPHAGYSYSGPTAAFSYARLKEELERSRNGSSNGSTRIRHILVLHPSHHEYLNGCAVSGAAVLETPVGNLRVSDELRREIFALDCDDDDDYDDAQFRTMSKRVDEREHSGEMQYPYIAKVLRDCKLLDAIAVLPVMCGSISVSQETCFGRVLRNIIARPSVLTVVSTDFCHWGSRFSYQPTGSDKRIAAEAAVTADARGGDKNDRNLETLPIHAFIEQLDRRGMDLIAMQEPGAFAEYLKKTKNTICGRHAVAVWLRAITAAQEERQQVKVQFVRYDQSSAVQSMEDSSVSYASAVAVATNTTTTSTTP